jgi:pimeloyl-ACP methyl ester carboxylesterase
MTKTKKSIVFCHGIWADGSCFNKVIPTLQTEGYEVMSAQYGLDTNESDVATVKRTLGRVSNPAILVGHSYGGLSSQPREQMTELLGWSTSLHSPRTLARPRRVR